MTALEKLGQLFREERSRHHLIDACLLRLLDQVHLHVRDVGDRANRREPLIAFHRADDVERSGSGIVQVENDELGRGSSAHLVQRRRTGSQRTSPRRPTRAAAALIFGREHEIVQHR